MLFLSSAEECNQVDSLHKFVYLSCQLIARALSASTTNLLLFAKKWVNHMLLYERHLLGMTDVAFLISSVSWMVMTTLRSSTTVIMDITQLLTMVSFIQKRLF